MEITRTPGEGCIRLALRGRLDAAWSASVQSALSECVRSGHHAIELDLSEVAFISSAGIRVLLVTYRQLLGIEGRFAIVAASPEVREVLELAGMKALLGAASTPARAADETSVARRLDTAEGSYEVHPLEKGASIRVRGVGDPAALLERGALSTSLERVAFPTSRIAVGVGAFGSSTDCGARLGELLALAGAAVTLPTTGEGRPDWMVCEERLVPEAELAYGLVGDGPFAWQARFDAHESGPIPLTALVTTALEIAATDMVAIAIVAEAAELVGAALRRSPLGKSAGIFGFPEVREQLDFTAEPAFADSVAVIAGFAARRAPADLSRQLRPLDQEGSLLAHLHAAAFPYRPLRKGVVALEATVHDLFESSSLRGLLHLLNDWRPTSGAGQTSLQRGALWMAPAVPASGGAA